MDNENIIKTIDLKNINTIKNKISELIEKTFIKLNIIHKKLLKKYLTKLVITFSVYYWNDNFINQMFMNNCQDIFSLMVLLLPYYELNKSKIIESLDELFINSGSGAKKLESSYWIDHLNFKSNPNYLEDYFYANLLGISDTLMQTHCVCLPNWLNIFPYTLKTYKTSLIYKNFIYLYKNYEIYSMPINNVIDPRKEIEEPIITIDKSKYMMLGFPILYGIVYNFLFQDIKQIKWMIYDINIDKQKIIPNIIYLADKLGISKIITEPYETIGLEKKTNLENLWKEFYTSQKTNQISLKSLVLFYLRWEKDNDKIKDLVSSKCLNLISTNLENIEQYDKNDLDDLDEKDVYGTEIQLNNCLKKIYSKIKYENLYSYIYQMIHRFGYTWYGFVCMDNDKTTILSEDNFYKKYFELYESEGIVLTKSQETGGKNLKYYEYVTPKNIYNYCKNILHYNTSSTPTEYIILSKYGKWDNVSYNNKLKFVEKINRSKLDVWFNIKNNIARLYGNTVNSDVHMNKLINFFSTSTMFVEVIFQTLVTNGMFSYYKYNPILTDKSIIPDKNINFSQWLKHMESNTDISLYSDSYNAFSNRMLKSSGTIGIDAINKSGWFRNFGADWVAQIQLFHHYLHNRVMFITGATGAGKSTLAPFILVYAVKILNFNNNARVVCTQPRTQPVVDNSDRMASSIGYPYVKKLSNDLDNTDSRYKKVSIGDYVEQDINYIQFKHKNQSLTDELYHPCLRLYTDGSLYNIIKEDYFFKKKIKTNKSDVEPIYLKTNIFDIVLVDEAHEHNTYMDMILTLSKFATYINNQITLGIISATMDDDEIIYRKYFEPIDNNWKAPVNITYTYTDFITNYNYIDRRIHLSVPFGGMNFEVKEYPNQLDKYPESVGTFEDMKKINVKVMEILNYILTTSTQGDILIFQPGESNINKLLKEINEKTPGNVIALPFYSKLDKQILENVVKKIDKPQVRALIRYNKNKYGITDMNRIPQDELLPAGTYNRFVILATNIAEASITIDTFVYVIDVGNQKIMKYDPETNQDYLETIPIAVPNQKQRKGRVGRVKPGKVYYTYDRTKLGEKVIYKINIENISSFVLDLVTSTDKKLFTEQTDPYKTNSLANIIECLQTQYTWTDEQDQTQLYGKGDKYPFEKTNVSKIIYPYSDGKYKLETLEDETGEFYLIHPNEDYWERDPTTLEIVRKNVLPNYFNKVSRAFEFGKITKMIGDNNVLSGYGKLVNAMSDFIEFPENSIEFTKMILDCESLQIDTNSDLYKNILLFIVFKTTKFNFKIPNYLVGKADYLVLSGLINSELFDKINFMADIFPKLDDELKNYSDIIKSNVIELVNNLYGANSNSNIEETINVLISFYTIKFKIMITYVNNQFILQKEFKPVYETLVKIRKDDWEKISDGCKIVINKILLFYISGGELMRRGVLKVLSSELEKLNKQNTSDKITKIINSIKKSLETSIFKNDFLPKIDLESNISLDTNTIVQFNQLTDYDKLCFVIIKNFSQNILVKIPFTEFYVGYYRKDINILFRLEKVDFLLGKKKIEFTKTKVPQNISGYYIFGVSMNDNYDLTNIMVLSEFVVNCVDKYFKSIGLSLFKKNDNFSQEMLIKNYDDEKKREMILKKIDKITEYIRQN